jgi:hypothetical protein
MKRIIDLKGKKFGRLTVLEHVFDGSLSKWKCKCSCGNLINVFGAALRKGNNKSCGCLFKDSLRKVGRVSRRWKGYGEVPYNYFRLAKTGAKKRGLEFKISIEYIWRVFLKQKRICAISGVEITFGNAHQTGTASLDRIDSNKGYIKGNVQWVHKIVNRMKSNLSDEELIAWSKIISKRYA